MPRRVVHVDMDEFFAAVEKLDNPALRGKCLLIGGDPSRRGVVCTASYEARKFGCHSAMPMARAVRLCPQALVLPVRGRRYQQVSKQIFDTLEQFTPLVEPLSIDEAFLDLTGTERLFGPAEDAAVEIKRRIREQLGLCCSVGVAPNKFLAKLASDLDKPDGLVVITPENMQKLLDPLGIDKLWGVGPAGEKRFARLNIRTIGQLRRAPTELLRQTFGHTGEHFQRLANGQDSRPVRPDSKAKSISQEQTFAVDIDDASLLRQHLLDQVQQVARRLRRHALRARTVTLKLRHGDFTTLTRSCTLGEATSDTEELWQRAQELFDHWASEHFRPLRLLGMGASQLQKTGAQLNLFESADQRKRKRLDETLDQIVERFGNQAVRRGAPARPPDNK